MRNLPKIFLRSFNNVPPLQLMSRMKSHSSRTY